MPSSPSIPLFEVLEEEYVSLHSKTLETVDIELVAATGTGTRTIQAHQDWKFDKTHFRDIKQFAAELLMYAEPETTQQRQSKRDVDSGSPPSTPNRTQVDDTVCTRDWAKQNLVRYLVEEDRQEPLKLETLRALRDGVAIPDDALDKFTASLNARLLDSKLYASERFPWNWLYTASRTLVAQYYSGHVFKGENLERFNRLLIEDAFTQFIERTTNIRLAAMYKRFHSVEQNALCLSGGGIRSGTFALGILQGLARHNLLKEFHYLSTVSGGGYIGSWLTAWVHRHDKGLSGVTRELANSTPRTKIDPDPSPIRYLRTYSNFITPKVGLLTADTWTFIGIYLRNLLLNWLVIIPVLLGLLTLPRLLVAVLNLEPPQYQILRAIGSVIYFPTFSWRHIFLAVGIALGASSLAYVMFNRPALRDELQQSSRFWHYRASQRGFLTYCLLPLLASGLCLSIYWAWKAKGETPSTFVMAIFGVVFTLFAWTSAGFVLGRLVRPKSWRRKHVSALLGLLVSGALAGSLIAVASRIINFGNPTSELNKLVWRGWSDWKMEIYAVVGVPVFLLLVALGLTIFVGLSSAGGVTGEQGGIDDEDREWWARATAWLVIAITGWIAVTGIVLFGPIVLLKAPEWIVSIGGISGLLTILLGRSALTPATAASATTKTKTALLTSQLLSRILPLLGVIFLLAFLATLSLATTALFPVGARQAQEKLQVNAKAWTNIPAEPALQVDESAIYPAMAEPNRYLRAKLIHMNVVHHTHFLFVFAVGGILFFIGMALSLLIKLNIFSLHGGYRNRLIRAFLGASRRGHERKPNPFTGFDPADNVSMYELRPELFNENDLIDPVGLVTELTQLKSKKVTRWLVKNKLVDAVERLPSTTAPSSRLISALRKDLNAVLHIPNLQAAVEDDSKSVNLAGAVGNKAVLIANRKYLEKEYEPMFRTRADNASFKLMPVINTTLNLVAGKNLAWQQRKAEPFSITPLYSGCLRIGYSNSREYGGRESGGISIGTAAAISGAAASSNMGYYTTSPVISLILTLFNVRLGWWLGNPGPTGDGTYYLRAPKSSVMPVVHEALGLTNDENRYVYLSDGGHFENLGLYEMVLRRCRTIVVCDAAQDERYRFGDLGNAIRKIRIDLGIPIEFQSMPIFAGWPASEKRGMYWAIADIKYSCVDGKVDNGTLLYVKPAIYGTEPGDVLEYKKSFPAFPHQSTADQFFDEAQFESYRMLGSHIMDQICGDQHDDMTLKKMVENARGKLEDYQRAQTSKSQTGEERPSPTVT